MFTNLSNIKQEIEDCSIFQAHVESSSVVSDFPGRQQIAVDGSDWYRSVLLLRGEVEKLHNVLIDEVRRCSAVDHSVELQALPGDLQIHWDDQMILDSSDRSEFFGIFVARNGNCMTFSCWLLKS